VATDLATGSGNFWIIEAVFDPLRDGMIGVECGYMNFEILTYKVTKANKTPPPLRNFSSRKP
jgi:peptide methionine sulfoxide reductase MsrA